MPLDCRFIKFVKRYVVDVFYLTCVTALCPLGFSKGIRSNNKLNNLFIGCNLDSLVATQKFITVALGKKE